MDEGVCDARQDHHKIAHAHRLHTCVHEALFVQKNCSSGFSGQTLAGVTKHQPTDQDHLSLTDRSSQQWVKSATSLVPAEQISGLALFMDGAISSVPLLHDHKLLDDAEACSSHDFDMRVSAHAVVFNDGICMRWGR